MEEKDKKKREGEDDGLSCEIEGCREIKATDQASNRKVMELTRNFIQSLFSQDNEENS